MSLQPVRDVDLIRHAYVLPGRQRRGVRATSVFAAAEYAGYAGRHQGGSRRKGDLPPGVPPGLMNLPPLRAHARPRPRRWSLEHAPMRLVSP